MRPFPYADKNTARALTPEAQTVESQRVTSFSAYPTPTNTGIREYGDRQILANRVRPSERFGMFEFLVDSISPEGLVIGRNANCDIPAGTTFTAIMRHRVHMESGGYRTEGLGEVGQVALTVREVHWYHRTIDHIPRGHTAGLAVTGDGVTLLAGLLHDLPPHEYLSLVAAEPKIAEPRHLS